MSKHCAFWGCLGATILWAYGATAAEGVKITDQEGKLRVEVNGKLFTEYHYQGAPHVYFYPLIGPGGLPMTRNYPMVKDSENEAHDHPHHRSLWYSHGAVNGLDFWAETGKSGKIVHDKFLAVKSGEESGTIKSQNKWIAPDGKTTCLDERVFRVYAGPDHARIFDYEITFKAGAEPITLGDTKEGSMALRIAESMRLTQPKGQKKGEGKIVQSTGVTDDKTWGKRAAWCDYYGPVQGKVLGIAMFDHPSNPRHPTWWHVRDYGLFAANPFGIHDFEKKPAGTGDLVIPAGQSVSFKYRFYLHEGDTEQGKVAEWFEKYAKTGAAGDSK
jgi:hypothetical protein